MSIRGLETARGRGSGGEVGQQLLAKLVDLKLDFIFVNTGVWRKFVQQERLLKMEKRTLYPRVHL